VTQMCAPKIPASLTRALEQCNSKEEMCEAGIRFTIEQCRQLKEWGVSGFHFYTLNRSGVVSTILEEI
jgi:methylenetetrahydrofolate reductase (NADPH)